jgi:hypothetical protein
MIWDVVLMQHNYEFLKFLELWVDLEQYKLFFFYEINVLF